MLNFSKSDLYLTGGRQDIPWTISGASSLYAGISPEKKPALGQDAGGGVRLDNKRTVIALVFQENSLHVPGGL